MTEGSHGPNPTACERSADERVPTLQRTDRKSRCAVAVHPPTGPFRSWERGPLLTFAKARGDVVGGKYSLVSELARGGMGTVWCANHINLNCPIALKLINPIIARDPQALDRFLREARTAAALRSPHVVQIMDYGVDGDTPYIAMEMLDGESLAERLKRTGRLSGWETARVIRHVARALARAHEAGVVHRDLKPENIFVVKNDDEDVIKVLDFGIAKTKTSQVQPKTPGMATHAGTLMGTPYFMSPEQAQGASSVDFRADLWALGVVAFECLLGELPFRGDSVARLILAICNDPLPVPSEVGRVPSGFDAWFARACARSPMARFESAKQAADEFEQLDSGAMPAPASRRPLPVASPSAASVRRRAIDDTPLGASASRVRSHARGVRIRWAVMLLAAVLVLGGVIRFGSGWFADLPANAGSSPALGEQLTRVERPTAAPVESPGPTGEATPKVADAPWPDAPRDALASQPVAGSDPSTASEGESITKAKPSAVNGAAQRSRANVRSSKATPETRRKSPQRARTLPRAAVPERPPKPKPPRVDLGI